MAREALDWLRHQVHPKRNSCTSCNNTPGIITRDEGERFREPGLRNCLRGRFRRFFDVGGVDAELFHPFRLSLLHRILQRKKRVAVGARVAEHSDQHCIPPNQLPPVRVGAGGGGAVDARRPHDRRVDPMTKALQRRDLQRLAGVDDVAPLVDGGRNVNLMRLHVWDERPENVGGQLNINAKAIRERRPGREKGEARRGKGEGEREKGDV